VDSDIISIVKELAAGGFATFLVAILVAGRYRIWVWGYHLDEVIKERDTLIAYERAEKEQFKQLLLDARELTNRSVDLASKVVRGGQ
jgi:hypothetical protein